MTLDEIKVAIDAGKKVHWCNETYNVVKDSLGRYLIVYDDNCIGLTHQDGITLNGEPDEFYLPETEYITTKEYEKEASKLMVLIAEKRKQASVKHGSIQALREKLRLLCEMDTLQANFERLNKRHVRSTIGKQI